MWLVRLICRTEKFHFHFLSTLRFSWCFCKSFTGWFKILIFTLQSLFKGLLESNTVLQAVRTVTKTRAWLLSPAPTSQPLHGSPSCRPSHPLWTQTAPSCLPPDTFPPSEQRAPPQAKLSIFPLPKWCKSLNMPFSDHPYKPTSGKINIYTDTSRQIQAWKKLKITWNCTTKTTTNTLFFFLSFLSSFYSSFLVGNTTLDHMSYEQVCYQQVCWVILPSSQ